MKIRHKQSGATIEGNFVDAGPDFKEITPGGYSLYYKRQWEEVQEWVDVTSECRFGTYNGFAEEGLEGWGYITAGNKGSVMHPDHWNKVLKIELVDGGIRVYARKGSAPW